ncbi:MAG TPA: hypothetical protein VMV41_08095 [Cellulomonadaceae bacterium]|nr:hypothetical protein [Cellulomonadaceae bacterium]
MSTEDLHFVTVTHERDEDGDVIDSTLTFECRGTIDSPCHLYPDDVESFSEVERDRWTKHENCWLKEWFEVGEDATPYTPGDGLGYDLRNIPDGSGAIDYKYDECILWSWIDGPTDAPQAETLNLTADAVS